MCPHLKCCQNDPPRRDMNCGALSKQAAFVCFCLREPDQARGEWEMEAHGSILVPED